MSQTHCFPSVAWEWDPPRGTPQEYDDAVGPFTPAASPVCSRATHRLHNVQCHNRLMQKHIWGSKFKPDIKEI